MVVGAFGLFQWKLALGGSLEEARTVAANLFVMAEIGFLFNCRSLSSRPPGRPKNDLAPSGGGSGALPEPGVLATRSAWSLGLFSNPWLLVGVASMLLLQGLFTYLPAMQAVFGTTALGLEDWLWLLAAAAAISLVASLEKWLRR